MKEVRWEISEKSYPMWFRMREESSEVAGIEQEKIYYKDYMISWQTHHAYHTFRAYTYTKGCEKSINDNSYPSRYPKEQLYAFFLEIVQASTWVQLQNLRSERNWTAKRVKLRSWFLLPKLPHSLIVDSAFPAVGYCIRVFWIHWCPTCWATYHNTSTCIWPVRLYPYLKQVEM